MATIMPMIEEQRSQDLRYVSLDRIDLLARPLRNSYFLYVGGHLTVTFQCFK